MKTTFKLMGAASLLVLGSATASLAADIITPDPVPPQVVEDRIKGAFEFGMLKNHFGQTDEPREGTDFGLYGSAFMHIYLNPIVIGFDLQSEYYHIENDFDEHTPSFHNVMGMSANYNYGAGLIGAFGVIGATNADDENSGIGYVGGVQATWDVNSQWTVFGHYGMGSIRVDQSDSGFTGHFWKAGALYAMSDDMAFVMDGGMGHSEDYEDSGDDGDYTTLGIKGIFKMPTSLPLFATAGYEWRQFNANTEDTANESVFKLGLSIPFGANRARDTFNPIASPTTPFRSAAYGEVLD